jgi:hypothetical protein
MPSVCVTVFRKLMCETWTRGSRHARMAARARYSRHAAEDPEVEEDELAAEVRE